MKVTVFVNILVKSVSIIQIAHLTLRLFSISAMQIMIKLLLQQYNTKKKHYWEFQSKNLSLKAIICNVLKALNNEELQGYCLGISLDAFDIILNKSPVGFSKDSSLGT